MPDAHTFVVQTNLTVQVFVGLDVAPHILVRLLDLTHPRGYGIPFDRHVAFTPGNLYNPAIAGERGHQVATKEQQLSTPRLMRSEGR
jgi:hypothetical protein